ncbi:c-type cytochrome domain-containing protein [Persicirhabdus sediminis]|uniref:Cytochrome C Planctomycete-type domain-containing protein n=1 Tax=Persicirhabdus sediminis TaxID=454144 RepID=A0A8J7MB41_9BACT|nr:c-type cytochrome domain-containing protein [Persicirhabdus sediminis]MBK1790269.1 hypothetical protein [Persicirhabdus sediminis]
MESANQSTTSKSAWVAKPYVAVICAIITLALIALPVFFKQPVAEASAWLIFLGKFHPVVLHLPIGMLLMVIVLELNAKAHKTRTSVVPLLATFVSTVAALVFGYLLFLAGEFDTESLDAHFWSSVVFTVFLVWTIYIKIRSDLKNGSQLGYFVMLAISTFLMSASGHYGGIITHGDPLDSAPWVEKEKRSFGRAADDQPAGVADLLVYEQVIIPYFEAKCYSCHNDKKQRGSLRMDTYDFMLEGGEEGPCLVPGNLDESLMIVLTRLPLDDDYRMAPSNKPQLTESEQAVMEWWVAEGAPQNTKLGDMQASAEIIQHVQQITKAQLAEEKLAEDELEVESAEEASSPNE